MFSFVIVSYNTKNRLLSCLQSLEKAILHSGYNSEIIVVDNASSDGTKEALANLSATTIFNTQNLGFARACNQGAREAHNDFIFFVNSDAEMTFEVLEKVYKTFLDYEQVSIISPALYDTNAQRELFACGNFPNLHRLLTRSVAYSGAMDKSFISPDWVSGAALAIRRSVFKQLEGFDEKFFMYFDDIDLCLRNKKLGYENFFLPEVKLTHYRGASLVNNRLRKRYYYSSQFYYFRKHFGLVKAALLAVLRLPFYLKAL